MQSQVSSSINLRFLPTPSARRATHLSVRQSRSNAFLPTPSARRATYNHKDGVNPHKFLPTPSARRATLKLFICAPEIDISTHALREEGDLCLALVLAQHDLISTHALREEGDVIPFDLTGPRFGFLPTPSARRATQTDTTLHTDTTFLPTPSARRATCSISCAVDAAHKISTHALREEGDGCVTCWEPLPADFYPRPPRGGRRSQ